MDVPAIIESFADIQHAGAREPLTAQDENTIEPVMNGTIPLTYEETQTCPVCHLIVADFESLQRHIADHLNEVGSGRRIINTRKRVTSYPCEACGLIQRDLQVYAKHMKKIHMRSLPRCQVCSKIYPNTRELMKHMNQHDPNVKLDCELCHFKFENASELTQHLLGHLEPGAKKCPVCFNVYGSSNTLKKHMKIHSGERNHKCTICEMYFFQEWDVARHVLTKSHITKKAELISQGLEAIEPIIDTKLMVTAKLSFIKSLTKSTKNKADELKKKAMMHGRMSVLNEAPAVSFDSVSVERLVKKKGRKKKNNEGPSFWCKNFQKGKPLKKRARRVRKLPNYADFDKESESEEEERDKEENVSDDPVGGIIVKRLISERPVVERPRAMIEVDIDESPAGVISSNGTATIVGPGTSSGPSSNSGVKVYQQFEHPDRETINEQKDKQNDNTTTGKHVSVLKSNLNKVLSDPKKITLNGNHSKNSVEKFERDVQRKKFDVREFLLASDPKPPPRILTKKTPKVNSNSNANSGNEMINNSSIRITPVMGSPHGLYQEMPFIMQQIQSMGNLAALSVMSSREIKAASSPMINIGNPINPMTQNLNAKIKTEAGLVPCSPIMSTTPLLANALNMPISNVSNKQNVSVTRPAVYTVLQPVPAQPQVPTLIVKPINSVKSTPVVPEKTNTMLQQNKKPLGTDTLVRRANKNRERSNKMKEEIRITIDSDSDDDPASLEKPKPQENSIFPARIKQEPGLENNNSSSSNDVVLKVIDDSQFANDTQSSPRKRKQSLDCVKRDFNCEDQPPPPKKTKPVTTLASDPIEISSSDEDDDSDNASNNTSLEGNKDSSIGSNQKNCDSNNKNSDYSSLIEVSPMDHTSNDTNNGLPKIVEASTVVTIESDSDDDQCTAPPIKVKKEKDSDASETNKTMCPQKPSNHKLSATKNVYQNPKAIKGVTAKNIVFCTECNKAFLTQGFLNKHMKTHEKKQTSVTINFPNTGTSQYMCVSCCKMFTSESALEEHNEQYDGKCMSDE